MRKLKLILAATFLFIIGNEISVEAQEMPKVTAEELKSWITYISSDEMKGRANGSPEMKTVSEWIAGKFSQYGLRPLFSDGKFIQNYSYTGRQQQKIEERNVIGIIEGNDPKLKDQYLFLTAHFDHVGIRKGASDDSIYNGADDNGAGTITLIAIARAFKESGAKPGRTIVFAAFSGEENAMRGSRYFMSNSPVQVKNIYADINFEMIGHSESYGKDNYYMTGCDVSDLDDLIRTFPGAGKINLIDTIKVAKQLFFASDNISFSRISTSPEGIVTGIPSGTFATTTHAPYIHSPEDEAGLFDFDNMANLTNYFSEMVLWLSRCKSEINWTNPRFSRPK